MIWRSVSSWSLSLVAMSVFSIAAQGLGSAASSLFSRADRRQSLSKLSPKIMEPLQWIGCAGIEDPAAVLDRAQADGGNVNSPFCSHANPNFRLENRDPHPTLERVFRDKKFTVRSQSRRSQTANRAFSTTCRGPTRRIRDARRSSSLCPIAAPPDRCYNCTR